jgi:POT family proton-dependent oligopeptide transporter
MSEARAVDSQWFGHPRGLSTLFFTELWERLSYYGMRAILVLFMVDQIGTGGFGMNDAKAAAIYGLYTAGVYLFALPGGWVADRLLGQQSAIFWGGCVIAAGHFTMALPILPGLEGLDQISFYAGLILIVIGTGLLKPNVSAVVGSLYKGKGARRDAGFSIFYMGINVGALAGPLICGYLGEEVDWHLGFSAAGFGMLAGLIQFKLTQKHLGESGNLAHDSAALAVRKRDWGRLGAGVAALLGAVLALVFLRDTLGLTLEGVAQATGVVIVGLAILYFGYVLAFGGLTSRERKRIFVIFLLFIGASLFWSGFEQAGSSMNLFAERHTDRVGPVVTLLLGISSLALVFFLLARLRKGAIRSVLLTLVAVLTAALVWWSFTDGVSFETPASWLQSVNALFIIVFAPVFAWLWVALGSREPSIPLKFGIGLILLGLGFLVLSAGSRALDGGVTPWWLISTYFLHTVGELCLSPVGLSSVTKLAPNRYVGQMMGTWFMGTALGNLVAGLVAGRIESMPLPSLFGTVAAFVIVAGVLFVLFTIPIKRLIGDFSSSE